jgi:predicted transcriptional regulator
VSTADTSTDALISITHIRGKLQRRVFKALIEYDNGEGATCDELERMLNIKHQTLSARVRELYLGGFIRKTKRLRRTSSGRYANVYRVRRRRKPRKKRDRCPHCGQVMVKR